MLLWANPFLFAGLLAVPALLAIYLMRNRFRRVEVSAAFLWERVARVSEGRGRLRSVPLPPPFWLELLAAVMLTLAAADPRWLGGRERRPMVVVVDDSFSMRAKVDGDSFQSKARLSLMKELRAAAPSYIRVVTTGTEPRIGARTPSGELSKPLKGWECLHASASLDKAVSLARSSEPDALVLILSDHPPTEPITDPMVKWIAVGQPLDNHGILNAARSPSRRGKDRIVVEVCHFGAGTFKGELSFSLSTGGTLRETVAIPSGEVKTVMETVPAEGDVKVSLGSDQLDVDNEFTLPPARRPIARFRNEIKSAPLRRMVDKALRNSGVAIPDPDKPGIVFIDAERPEIPSTGAETWLVRFHRPVNGKLLTGPFIIDHSSPLCEGLDLEGHAWRGSALDGDALPLVMAGDISLVATSEQPDGGRLIDISLDVEHSTLSKSPNWPILFWNLLQWRAASAPGFGTDKALCGQRALFNAGADVTFVSLTTPDGSVTNAKLPAGKRQLTVVMETPGLHYAKAKSGSYKMACLPGTPDESDLTRCGKGVYGGWGKSELLPPSHHSAAAPLALLAAVALLAHAWYLNRRKG